MLIEWIQRQAGVAKTIDMSVLFAQDPHRAHDFRLHIPGMYLDLSHHLLTREIWQQLAQLAEKSGLSDYVQAMLRGEPINHTENRPVLHTALRAKACSHPSLEQVYQEQQHVLNAMQHFVTRVHHGEIRGFTGQAFTDIVNIGIGGSDLGPRMVTRALHGFKHSAVRVHFVSNVDPTDLRDCLEHLSPATTLFLIASKTFTTQETMLNAERAKQWVTQAAGHAPIDTHFVGISTSPERMTQWGILPEHQFLFHEGLGGRYSVCSSIGLSVALAVGMSHFQDFMRGAQAMDEHFLTAPFQHNIPAMLALLGLWYRHAFQVSSQVVLAYHQRLSLFVEYLQQVDLESNGKSVLRNGEWAPHPTAPILWGGVGTNAQHAFCQWLHQGTDMAPVDFIAVAKPQYREDAHAHRVLLSNCLAQSKALMQGRNPQETYQTLLQRGYAEQEAKALTPHSSFPGNRPSSVIMLDQLSPYHVGLLVACYEHKVLAQSFFWNINAFDQFGVELGKTLAQHMLHQMPEL